MNSTSQSPTVFVVDDDASMRKSLTALLEAVNHHVKTFASAQDFLNDYDPTVPGCLVVDVRMPNMTGLSLIKELRKRNIELPAVVITAYGDVPTAVDAMKSGAVDFLEKPFSGTLFLDRVQQAFDKGVLTCKKAIVTRQFTERLHTLSKRERQVLCMLVDGMLNKQVAQELDLSEKTISAHRARILEKMEINSIVELVQIMEADLLKKEITPEAN